MASGQARKRSPRVVVAAGGTAGHVVPALAVADALRAKGAEILFISASGRGEAGLLERAGYQVRYLTLSGLDRRNPFKALAAIARTVRAVPKARALLREWKTDVVVGGGGYVAAPVGLAAARLGVPLVLTEADSYLGVTNRLLARRARRVCLAFPIAGREGGKYLVTGRPVRAVASAGAAARVRAEYGFADGDTLLLVFGGSQGAHTLNEAALEAFARDDLAIGVLHVAGRRDFPDLRARLDASGAPAGYRLVDFIDDFDPVLAAADLVVGRAGASVFELAAAGKPAILIPYPHATGDHQRRNAEWMASAGAAVTIDDGELNGARLRAEVERLLADRARLVEIAQAARSLAKPDAAERVATQTLEAAGYSQQSSG